MADSDGRPVAARSKRREQVRYSKPRHAVGDLVLFFPYSWEQDRREGLHEGLGQLPCPPAGRGTITRVFPREYLCYEVEMPGRGKFLYSRGDVDWP